MRETADQVARDILPDVEVLCGPLQRPFPGQGNVERMIFAALQSWKTLDPAAFEVPIGGHSGDVSRLLVDRFRRMAGELRSGEHSFATNRERASEFFELMASKMEHGSARARPN